VTLDVLGGSREGRGAVTCCRPEAVAWPCRRRKKGDRLGRRWATWPSTTGPKWLNGPAVCCEIKMEKGNGCWALWAKLKEVNKKLVFEFLAAEMDEFKWKFEFK
jgi:hypothetical protein